MNFIKRLFRKEKNISRPKELDIIFNKKTIQYDDIKPTASFDEKKFNILILDDNPGAVELINFEIDVILKKKKIVSTMTSKTRLKNTEIIKDLIESNNIDIDIQKISGNYALFKLDKLFEKESPRIDYAIIDIVFGGIIIKDNNKYILNGIDIAKKIKEINPKVNIILFTGCDLEINESLKATIIESFGTDFYNNNVIIKSPLFCNRLRKYSAELIKSLREYINDFR